MCAELTVRSTRHISYYITEPSATKVYLCMARQLPSFTMLIHHSRFHFFAVKNAQTINKPTFCPPFFLYSQIVVTIKLRQHIIDFKSMNIKSISHEHAALTYDEAYYIICRYYRGRRLFGRKLNIVNSTVCEGITITIKVNKLIINAFIMYQMRL